MVNQTPRLTTPYIISTQSQKEVTHNMALNILDALVQTAVETATLVSPPMSPPEGGLWLVASVATGDWLGHDGKIAQYIGGAWQFHAPFEGLLVWLKDDDVAAQFRSGLWQTGVVTAHKLEISGQQVVGPQQPAVGDAAAGAVIDVEARTALNNLLAACRNHGLIAS
ncbi:MAG: DUF2793 domain-containing protein [Emcibacter sp.]|nr:DUF2793 domain-containing protein [Emcibacter sp.]